MPTVTRKIRLVFDCEKEVMKANYDRLFKWQRIIHKAANWIVTHQYLQDQLKDIFYITENTKVKLGDIKKDENGILTTSRDNTTYQLLSKAFKGECPMGMLSGLNTVISHTYKKESSQIRSGERSLRNYRSNIPMPIRNGDITSIKKLNDGNYSIIVYGVNFKTFFGRDLSGNEIFFDLAIAGEYKLCDSSLSLKKNTKTKKWEMFLLAVFKFDQKINLLDKEKTMFIRLGEDIPFIFHFGGEDMTLGGKEEFEHRLNQIQHGLHRAKIASRFNKGGKGRNKKLQATERYSKWEKDYIDTRIHQYTSKLIDLCLKFKCGNIVFEKECSPNAILNGRAYSIEQKLQYKADIQGIKFSINEVSEALQE